MDSCSGDSGLGRLCCPPDGVGVGCELKPADAGWDDDNDDDDDAKEGMDWALYCGGEVDAVTPGEIGLLVPRLYGTRETARLRPRGGRDDGDGGVVGGGGGVREARRGSVGRGACKNIERTERGAWSVR